MKRKKLLILWLSVFFLFLFTSLWAEEVKISKEGVYVLTDFGDVSKVEVAKKTLDNACNWIIKNGGGILIIPPGVPKQLKIENTYQKDRTSGPTVTIIDIRNGYEVIHVPQVGKVAPMSGWYGKLFYRVLKMDEKSLPHCGIHDVVGIRNAVVKGATSYDQKILFDVKKGKDVKIYVPTIRGLYVGQFLTLTGGGYKPPYDRLYVKKIGWDKEKKLYYIVADLEYDHPRGALLYNKHVTGGFNLLTTSNCDNQTMEFQVTKKQYSHGDSFLISGNYIYQGDVISGFGDEMGVVMNAEVLQDVEPFYSVVEKVDWNKDEIIIKPGPCNIHKLATSRPIINMNKKKWITKGVVKIVPPDNWGGIIIKNPEYKDKIEEFVENGIDVKSFKFTYKDEEGKIQYSAVRYDGKPVREFKYTYKGKAYPSIIKGIINNIGGYIEGSADCGWTEDIVGRFFAVADPGEYLYPGEKTSGHFYGKPYPKKERYRWYLIKEFKKNPDGTFRIKIERIRYAAVNAGAPNLYNFENYTWDGHKKPLKYIIAPGAYVYDISQAWKDRINGFVYKNEPRSIKVVPNGDRNTPYDFEPGDPIEQAIGPDPAIPTPIRVRMFNGIPDTMEASAVSLQNRGKVAVNSGIKLEGGCLNRDDIVKRKDKKPIFENGFDIFCVVGNGIRFGADVTESAILFEQPFDHQQPIKWKHEKGETTLIVEPDTGNMVIKGSDLYVPNVNGLKGISGTKISAKNLRGINVPVPKGAKTLVVKFQEKEADENYSIVVQPNWFTEDRIVKKMKEGFVVEFSKPAPEKATIDWQLIR